VWPWFADPDRVARWNPKLESHQAQPFNHLREGHEYWVTYRLGSKSHQMRASLRRFRPPCELVVEYRGGDLRRDGWAREEVTIEERGDGSRVRRGVTFADPRIPWWSRPLIAFLLRFGVSVDEPQLAAVKRLVEAGGGDPA
jgi:hypothetical protein